MTWKKDVYDPHTSLGQTSHGRLIHNQEVLFEQLRERTNNREDLSRSYRKDEKSINELGYSEAEGNQLYLYGNRLKEGGALVRLAGKVRTYLTECGEFISTTPGWKVPKLKAVSKDEHYKRVSTCYRRFWKWVEQEALTDENLNSLLSEAHSRLDKQVAGQFPLPIHKGAFFASAEYEKKGLLGKKKVTLPVRDAKIEEYEKYLRRFIRSMFVFKKHPLRMATEPDGIWLVNNPLSKIRRERSANLGQVSMYAFMMHPQQDSSLIQAHLFSK